ncbi:putative membrane protein [Criblamydia sequanensis CRIB-18]|uniref:Membrane protein n=1 Tax=Candidatus Criblamydia sequanensis CRIB-18 TaxID=1437425 RepID=A0A090D1F0_9BACT|nr:putative membrane protein [Criblamydia sequanensis CRIB-18]
MTEPELLSIVKSFIFASILTLFIFMINSRREVENGFYKNLSIFFLFFTISYVGARVNQNIF